jgi:hypothetical protein
VRVSRPWLVAAVAAVLLLTAGALAGLQLITGDGPSAVGAPATASAPDPAGGAAPAPPAPVPEPFPPSPPPAAAPAKQVATELRDPWDRVPIAGRSRSDFGRALEAALADLESEVSRCFDPDVHARYGPRGFTEYRGQDGTGDGEEATLMLELEGTATGLRIVDAPVESRGAADPEVLACAQHSLAGRVLDVEGATPGARTKARLRVLP